MKKIIHEINKEKWAYTFSKINTDNIIEKCVIFNIHDTSQLVEVDITNITENRTKSMHEIKQDCFDIFFHIFYVLVGCKKPYFIFSNSS